MDTPFFLPLLLKTTVENVVHSFNIRASMTELRANDVDVVTLGQYMRPTKSHMKVVEYIPPHTFDLWRRRAVDQLGFLYCASGPLVRSSYKAGESFLQHVLKKRERKGGIVEDGGGGVGLDVATPPS